MKILQITASYKPAYIYGGPIISVSQLSEELVATKHSINVFTTTANGTAELNITINKPVIVDSVPVTYFKRLTKDHSHFSPALLRAVWTQAKSFDVIHIHAWWNLVSVLSCLIALMRHVPVIVSPRGTLSNYSFHNKNALYKRWIHALLSKPMLKKCTIHVTSAHEHQSLMSIINPKAYFNIPNFIQLPGKQNLPIPLASPIFKLLFLSRIEEKKGLDILLNALAGATIPYHLTIAGDGDPSYIAALKNLAADKNLSSHISWIGFRKEDKFAVLAGHQLLVLPSYDENFGNVITESLSVGTAVLVSEQVGLSAYVKENDLGWVCQTNANSVAAIINTMPGQQAKIAHIKAHAPDIISAGFGAPKLIQKYTDMYHKTIKRG